MAHLLGYARVSTLEQNPDLQVDELTAAGWKVCTDHASGALDRRPQLDAVLWQLRPGSEPDSSAVETSLLASSQRSRCRLSL